MGDVANLRQARKRRERAEREAAAEANRVRHGTPRALVERERLARDIEARRLEGNRREVPGTPGDDPAGG